MFDIHLGCVDRDIVLIMTELIFQLKCNDRASIGCLERERERERERETSNSKSICDRQDTNYKHDQIVAREFLLGVATIF